MALLAFCLIAVGTAAADNPTDQPASDAIAVAEEDDDSDTVQDDGSTALPRESPVGFNDLQPISATEERLLLGSWGDDEDEGED